MSDKLIRFLDPIYDNLIIAPDNIAIISEDVLLGSSFGFSYLREVVNFLFNEKVILRSHRRTIFKLSRIPLDHEKRQKLLGGMGPVFASDFYIVLEFSSREVFFELYKKFKSGDFMPLHDDKKFDSHQFPSDLRWEEITIQFLNGEEVIIKFRGSPRQTTAEEMGFQDKKKKSPNVQWKLLSQLASHDGELSWTNNRDLSQKDIDSIKKRKQKLADALKAYFGIKDDPFRSYRNGKSYRMKIALVPEAHDRTLRNDDDFGIKESFASQALEIDDSDEFTEE
jgi:hypothetical protein